MRSQSNRRYRTLIIACLILVLCGLGTAWASSGGGEEGAAHKGWKVTDTYRAMNFAVLVVALFFVLRKPVSQALNGRIQDIKDQLNELEAKKKSAEQQLAEYETQMAALDKEAEKIVADYIQQGEEAKRKILDSAKKAADKLEAQARRNVENEFEKAKMALRKEIMEKALVKAEAILKDKITSEDQDRLLDEYLDKVVAN